LARAGHRCEYCHLPAAVYPLPFHIDHIIARQHGGQATFDNLALACLHCNRHKGPNIAGVNEATGSFVRLFNPRLDEWRTHFEWNGHELRRTTSIGQITIRVLAINDPDIQAVRATLMSEGAYPL
jgi:hypothetical protein